jgi:PHP family Zn ribbon phosphoesterase
MFYYKPTNQDSSSTAITYSIFSQAENSITLGDGVEPTLGFYAQIVCARLEYRLDTEK